MHQDEHWKEFYDTKLRVAGILYFFAHKEWAIVALFSRFLHLSAKYLV